MLWHLCYVASKHCCNFYPRQLHSYFSNIRTSNFVAKAEFSFKNTLRTSLLDIYISNLTCFLIFIWYWVVFLLYNSIVFFASNRIVV